MEMNRWGYATFSLWTCICTICFSFIKTTFLQLFLFPYERNKSCLFVFFSSPSISPSWECRIKILALPIQTLPSSSKQKSIWTPLCKNVQRNAVPWVGSLTLNTAVYLNLRIYTSLMEPKFAFGWNFKEIHLKLEPFFFFEGRCSIHAKKMG